MVNQYFWHRFPTKELDKLHCLSGIEIAQYKNDNVISQREKTTDILEDPRIIDDNRADTHMELNQTSTKLGWVLQDLEKYRMEN
jgi:hypothetical protein